MWQLTGNKMYKESNKVPDDSLTALAVRGSVAAGEVRGSTLSAWCPFVAPGSKADWIVGEEVLSLGEFGVLTLLYPA